MQRPTLQDLLRQYEDDSRRLQVTLLLVEYGVTPGVGQRIAAELGESTLTIRREIEAILTQLFRLYEQAGADQASGWEDDAADGDEHDEGDGGDAEWLP